jgi:hypothetical protein
MVARSIPHEGSSITGADLGLIDAYNRLREAVCDVATDLQIDATEFERELPPLPPSLHSGGGPEHMMYGTQDAKTAATALRSLAGYVEGLIEAVVLDQQISMEQVKAAREAARQPPGFR